MQFDVTRRNGDVYTVFVDDADAAMVSVYKWRVSPRDRRVYVFTDDWSDGKRKTLFLHQLVMGAKGVDHINHDGLDNRRANLRLATPRQNLGNRRPQIGGTSRFKGVSWDSRAHRWKAGIDIDGRTRTLGYYHSEAEAAAVYDTAAVANWGEFALTNAIGA